MDNLIRANKVTVNVLEDGVYKADFYRTHKYICTVISTETGFSPIEGMTKSGVRELFRAYVIENANEYGVEWNPADMRADHNIRKASYATDQDLVDDARSMLVPMLSQLVDSCRYPIQWGNLVYEDIIPADNTAKGTPLSALGVIDGKYEKSGKWAWATIGFVLITLFKGEEVYMPISMDLVSGQLKKPKMGITVFNSEIKREIIDAGLATEEELEPPKESKDKDKSIDIEHSDSEESGEEPLTIDVEVDDVEVDDAEVDNAEVDNDGQTKPKSKGRQRSKKNAEVAE